MTMAASRNPQASALAVYLGHYATDVDEWHETAVESHQPLSDVAHAHPVTDVTDQGIPGKEHRSYEHTAAEGGCEWQ